MDDEQREPQQQPFPSSRDESSAPSTLESAASYVAASTAADGENHGSRSAFTTSFAAIMRWGEVVGLIKDEADFPFLKQPPTGHGDEHEGWFDEKSNRWYKATYPNRFGVAWGRYGSATAG